MTTGPGARHRRTAAVVVAPWALCALLRATGAERGYPLVPALAFTPYAAATSVVPLTVALRAGSRSAAAVAATAGAVLVGAVLGRLGRQPAADRPDAAGGRRLKVATVSLRLGRADPGAVVALVRAHRVDVLALQELTPEAEAALRAAGLDDELPHAHVVAARNGSPAAAGGGLWSRWPLLERCTVPGTLEQPSARVAVPGGPAVEVAAVHTMPPSTSPRSVRRWTEDLADLPAPAPGRLRVLAGDFNATLDHAALRRVVAGGYVDAARALGHGLRATWSPLRSPQPRLTLDHVLVDPQVGVAALALAAVPGSDHRALVTELVLPLRAD